MHCDWERHWQGRQPKTPRAKNDMTTTSINTDYYWDAISNLCGELLTEMETLVNEKYNGDADLTGADIYYSASKIKRIYWNETDEDMKIWETELLFECENGFVAMVREMEIDKMLEIAEVL